MELNKYFAIKNLDRTVWAGALERIGAIEDAFHAYTTDPRLVLIPRYNGNYLSFRYCGLEMLQVGKRGQLRSVLEERGGKIRRNKNPAAIAGLQDSSFLKTLKAAHAFLTEALHTDFSAKSERLIPGFSKEHWLESLVLGDTPGGASCRKALGLNPDLGQVVTQVPVIRPPLKAGGRRRSDHIDVMSVDDAGNAVIVELKQDDDLDTAKVELEKYGNWFKGINPNEFDPELGNPKAMISEGYLPRAPISPDKTKLVAVVTDGQPSPAISIIHLPKDWLRHKDGNPISV